jgi:phosphate ABC transporter phosphate-binding protein
MRYRCPASWIRNIFALACCLLAWPALSRGDENTGARTLYVEAFATKTGAEKLREDMTAELRKLASVSLVPDQSKADLVLGGGGEIWVRGYRSFSPRSHMKLPTNGTPIYGGYLSVELKNKLGVTVWSYLVTPGTPSEDISKELSKRIARHLADALDQVETPRPAAPPARPTIALNGAGATFPYPVYQKWFINFQTEDPGTQITYEPIGSDAGVHKLLAGAVDFGASEDPEAVREFAPADESKYLIFPSVVGAVVPIVNVPGVPQDIAFTPEALAGIFLGKITKWNDPILQRVNRHLHLPDLDIVVVHRADGSGTSYAWTDYLSKTSPQWKTEVGCSLVPKWPTGRPATGNDGVAKLVKELGGSIGYVEFIYALQNHLSYGRVRNRNGEFVGANLESIEAAVGYASQIGDDFKATIVDAPGEGSYPIASFTWIVVPTHIADDAKRSAIIAFLRWMLGPGQRQAAALGYLALPREVVAKEEDAIARIH